MANEQKSNNSKSAAEKVPDLDRIARARYRLEQLASRSQSLSSRLASSGSQLDARDRQLLRMAAAEEVREVLDETLVLYLAGKPVGELARRLTDFLEEEL